MECTAKRKGEYAHLALLDALDWGLIVYDEVHLLPAPVFRMTSAPSISRTDDLAEVDYGSWTNRPIRELLAEPLWKTVQQHPSAAVFPDGEGLAAVQRTIDGFGPGDTRFVFVFAVTPSLTCYCSYKIFIQSIK